MQSEDQGTPVSHGSQEGGGLGWLLQPTWEKDLFGEIAQAKVMTPALLGAFEEALAVSKEEPPMLASSCTQLTKCGTFEGSGPDHPCPNLKECDAFKGSTRTGGTTSVVPGTGTLKPATTPPKTKKG